jgi:hypothetical protein
LLSKIILCDATNKLLESLLNVKLVLDVIPVDVELPNETSEEFIATAATLILAASDEIDLLLTFLSLSQIRTQEPSWKLSAVCNFNSGI